MNESEIEHIFNKIFHNQPNMCFPHPVKYFKHNNYLCEVAESNTSDEGYYITVLDQYKVNLKGKPKYMYIHVHDLCTHINSLDELNDFIKNKLK